jgi:hypothetical protein
LKTGCKLIPFAVAAKNFDFDHLPCDCHTRLKFVLCLYIRQFYATFAHSNYVVEL